MVQETINLIMSRMNTMTDQEREKVMCALLNRYCVACGSQGDWSESSCDCEPGQHTISYEPIQLWLTYNSKACLENVVFP